MIRLSRQKMANKKGYKNASVEKLSDTQKEFSKQIGEPNAIQEPGTSKVDARKQTGDGEGVGQGNELQDVTKEEKPIPPVEEEKVTSPYQKLQKPKKPEKKKLQQPKLNLFLLKFLY